MKKFLMMSLFAISLSNGFYAFTMQQSLPTAVCDDAELMFDEIPDALDAVTVQDCNCSPVKVFNPEKETLLQACYQTALMYLLSSYLSIKNSCESAQQYLANLLAWAPVSSMSIKG